MAPEVVTHSKVRRSWRGTYGALDSAPKGLLTDSDSRVAFGARGFDMFTNMPARMGWGSPSLAESAEYNLVRLSYDYWLLITLYRNHWISRRIVDGPAQDMVRAWPKLSGDMPPEDLDQFERAILRTGTKQRMLETLQWARLFGGAGALIVVDGHEEYLDEPLDLDDVEPGSYRGLIPFDRWVGITPEAEICTDINRPHDFNKPEMYRVSIPNGSSFHVHSSRILRFTGPSVPTPEYEAQQWWGISVLEPVFEEIRKRDNMSWTILSRTFRSSILAMTVPGLGEALSGAGMNQAALASFYQRMQAFNQVLSNQGMVILPKEGQMQAVNAGNDAGVADIYQQFQLDIAGAAQYPVSRLFGRTITGLGQSNDADERIYEERIAQEQDVTLRPQMDKLFPVIAMSEWGEVPKDMGHTYPSIRVLTEEEKADLAQKSSQAVLGALNAGVMKIPMAMKELKQSSDITGIFTNITDEDIEEAEKQQEERDKLAESMPDLGGAFGLGGEQEEEEGGSPFASLQSMAGETASKKKQPEKQKPVPEKKKAADASREVASFEFAGIPITIEYQAGSRRRFRNDEGTVVYDRLLKFDYGFIDGTMGRDGDEIDVILGPDEDSPWVFVADMQDLGQDVQAREDEDKVLLGFVHPDDARRAFCTMYPPEFLRKLDKLRSQDFVENWLGRTEPPDLRACTDFTECCSTCGYFDQNEHRCQMFGGYPVTGNLTCDEWVGGTPGTMRAVVGDALLREADVRKAGRRYLLDRGIQCPKCGSTRFGLMPADFETAKCKECGKTWEIGIVPGINAPSRAEDWAESEHPRVPSGSNAGQFTKKGSGSTAGGKNKLTAAPPNRDKWPSHIKKLRIPPAWKDVKISLDPKADLQAIGTDIKGRPQYLYSEAFRNKRAEEKFARIKTLAKKFGEIDKQNQKDLRSPDERRRENAACARLVMKLGLRPGSEKDTGADVQAHGATTLEGRHVVELKDGVYLMFVGKKGVALKIPVQDDQLADMLRARAKKAGKDGRLFPDVTDKSLLDYTHSLDGGKFKTKDLRTYIANDIARNAMADVDPPTNEKEYKKACKAVAAVVSEKLGNTPTVALQSYINPELFAEWRAGVELGAPVKPKQPGQKEFRKSWVKPRNKKLTKDEGRELVARIESNGGTLTDPFELDDYDMWQLPDRGEMLNAPVKRAPKTKSQACHEMAARAWKQGLGTLYTGWAYGIKGEKYDGWVLHSWVVDPDGNILEGTPLQRKKYFGYPMTDKEAKNFVSMNT